jgi:hypothetical protein
LVAFVVFLFLFGFPPFSVLLLLRDARVAEPRRLS